MSSKLSWNVDLHHTQELRDIYILCKSGG